MNFFLLKLQLVVQCSTVIAFLFYTDYFKALAVKFSNFSFHAVLSEANPAKITTLHYGMVHQVACDDYLKGIEAAACEYYLCGPPALISSATALLTTNLGVPTNQIPYDEF